jgi:hypothetical protein
MDDEGNEADVTVEKIDEGLSSDDEDEVLFPLFFWFCLLTRKIREKK